MVRKAKKNKVFVPQESDRLFRFTTPYLTAGASFRQNAQGVWVCVDAAPIMHWIRGKTLSWVEIKVDQSKNYSMEEIEN